MGETQRTILAMTLVPLVALTLASCFDYYEPTPVPLGTYCYGENAATCMGEHIRISEGGDSLPIVMVPTAALEAAAKRSYPTSPGQAWTVGGGGTILRWGGWSWTESKSGTTETLRAVWGAAPDDVWAVGDHRTILRWNGNAWSDMAPAPSAALTTKLRSVWGSGANDVWIAGNDCPSSPCNKSAILHWDGATWTSQAETVELNSIWGSGPKDVWAAGAAGTILHWNGTAWSPSASGTTEHVWSIAGSAPDDVWAGVTTGTDQRVSGQMLHFDGTSWSKSASFDGNGVLGLWASGRSDAWAIGNFRSTSQTPTPHGKGDAMHWDGKSWTPFPIGTSSLLRGAMGTSPADFWAVGDEGIFHWNGSAWLSSVAVGYGGTSVWAFGPPSAPSPTAPIIKTNPLPGSLSGLSGSAPLDFDWDDPKNCRPGICLTVCPRNMRCAATSACIPSRGDGLRTGSSHYTVSYAVDVSDLKDFNLQVTPIASSDWANEPEKIIAGDPNVAVGTAVSVEHVIAGESSSGGSSSGSSGSGTCSGGWQGSERSCLPLGAGGSCDCNSSPTDTCITKSDYDKAGLPFPAACLPSGGTGCLATDGSGALSRACCPGLSCVAGTSCGVATGSVCAVK